MTRLRSAISDKSSGGLVCLVEEWGRDDSHSERMQAKRSAQLNVSFVMFVAHQVTGRKRPRFCQTPRKHMLRAVLGGSIASGNREGINAGVSC
jgi:hypothetical protein